MSNIDVKRTAKLFIGGAFPRSESGRTYEVKDKNKNFVANVALASRKDGRDAVVAARSAFAKWSEATAYNRAKYFLTSNSMRKRNICKYCRSKPETFIRNFTGSTPHLCSFRFSSMS